MSKQTELAVVRAAMEQIESFREGLPIGGRDNPLVGIICDQLLHAIELEQQVAEKDAEIAILEEEVRRYKSDNGIFGVGA